MNNLTFLISILGAISGIIAAWLSWMSVRDTKKYVTAERKLAGQAYLGLLQTSEVDDSDEKSIQNTQKKIVDIISNAAATFTENKATQISASLRLMNNGPDGVRFVVIARDKNSSHERRSHDVVRGNVQPSNQGLEVFLQNPPEWSIVSAEADKKDIGGTLEHPLGINWFLPSENIYFQSQLCVPVRLKNNNAILGVLAFDSQNTNAFNNDDVDFAIYVAGILSQILEKMVDRPEASS